LNFAAPTNFDEFFQTIDSILASLSETQVEEASAEHSYTEEFSQAAEEVVEEEGDHPYAAGETHHHKHEHEHEHVMEEPPKPVKRMVVVQPLAPKQYRQPANPQLRAFKDDVLHGIRAEIASTKRDLLSLLS